jgi:hypothetical protein
MTNPTPRSNVASQTSPCGDATGDNVPVNVTAGTYVTVSWINNGNSNNLVYLTLLTFPQMQIFRTVYNYSFNTNTRNVRIPPDVPAGQYYLQWWWSTYYSCSLLNVSADPTGRQFLQVSQTINNPVPVGLYNYYEITIDDQYNNRFLEISGTGPSGLVTPNGHITVVGIEGILTPPTVALRDNAADTRNGPEFRMGMCRNNNNEDDFVVGVYGGPNALQTDTYTLTVNIYDPIINSGQAFTSLKHNGYKYYRTDAYETDVPRRVVYRSDVDFGIEIPRFRLATNCDITTQIQDGLQTNSDTMCIQLKTTAGTKFIEVPPTESGYTVLTEVGKCDDIAAAPMAVASLLTLFALIYLAL